MKNKVVIITGAAMGLRYALALKVANLVLVNYNEKENRQINNYNLKENGEVNYLFS